MNENNTFLKVTHLSKTYKSREGRVEALKDLGIQVEKGKIIGLLGPNGAGKTTAVKLIMGFISPSSGEIIFQGSPLKVAAPRPNIGYLPESFRPNPNLTVYEYVKFQNDLAASKNVRSSREEITELLKLVGMDKFYSRRISDLSKGMGQRVGLAQAFSGNPDFLILDEPTSGLDPIGRSEIIEFLIEMKNRGKTIFFCSHILSEVEKICDQIGILVQGRLRFFGTVEDFLNKWGAEELEQAFKQEAQCTTS